jgi:hypothetical protein
LIEYFNDPISKQTPLSQLKCEPRVPRVIFQGLLEYDCTMAALPRDKKREVPIRMVYPSREFYENQHLHMKSDTKLSAETQEHF